MLVTVYNPGFSEPKVRSFETTDMPTTKVFFAFDVPDYKLSFMKQLPGYIHADKRVYVIQEAIAYSYVHKIIEDCQREFDLVVSSQKDISVNLQIPLIHTLLGEVWCNPRTHEEPKTFSVSYLPGSKFVSSLPGHHVRRNVSKYISLNSQKFPFLMDYYDPSHRIHDKGVIFDGRQFSIIIENHARDGYITEKLLDCVARRTVPIYRGAPDLKEHFNPKGIITFQTIDDLNHEMSLLNEETYNIMLPYVEENFEKLLKIRCVKVDSPYNPGIYFSRVIKATSGFFNSSL